MFGWKQVLSPGARVFANVFLLQKRASKRSEQTAVFNFVTGNATKIGVSEFFFKMKWSDPPFSFLSIFLDRKYPSARAWGVRKRRLLSYENTTKNKGFEAPRVKPRKARNIGNTCVQNWGACMRSIMGAYAAQHKHAPFLNALDDKQQAIISRQSLCRATWFHQGKTRFGGFKMVAPGGKKGTILEPWKTPRNWTQQQIRK